MRPRGLREAPSLRVSFNDETGQTVLSGMGELHLEVLQELLVLGMVVIRLEDAVDERIHGADAARVHVIVC